MYETFFCFWRRDEIDSSHYPVFHQVEGVRLLDESGLNDLWVKKFKKRTDKSGIEQISLFEQGGEKTRDKQGVHSLDAAKLIEIDLKECLVGLAQELFGKGRKKL